LQRLHLEAIDFLKIVDNDLAQLPVDDTKRFTGNIKRLEEFVNCFLYGPSSLIDAFKAISGYLSSMLQLRSVLSVEQNNTCRLFQGRYPQD
jgi:hypothetical protein